ncbi:Sulfite exporter, TauE/SafE family [Halalkaliarchaeum sp. AArc-CO]|uniref:sulfite exporter TauE/SafE family protein n=1 Tax=unclassified Halalkaliarchaeum TaxID=2678344 RepID=UPI00217CEA3D|nr:MULTISPECIES: sulfite exporter TauE/SafE family protein [unclassified Halalkaliarchaeum]MDR5671645.1 sulfite exporter TauE/SafE family protein [Halalkaliarchaeum sp. AArc-GB]UWG51146.1 Sulfite exporter, TauE/SafE family [Halalkaliarchaeum sp. AArc-CO]
MSIAFTPELLLAVAAVAAVAGAVNGVAGFGFAVVGTMALATMVDPAAAVVFMILPIFAVNLSLVGELSGKQLRTCGRRFGPLLGAALLGTIAGLILLERLPEAPLRVGLGLVSLGFVATAQRRITIPGLGRVRDGCFVETPAAMAGVGGVSGVLFGATNVGVQLVAYVRSCDLSHGLFVGVVAMVFLGLNGVRVAAAGALGLYPDLAFVAGSIGAVVPAVAGVRIGAGFRDRVSEARRRGIVLGLLAVIGVRLVFDGFAAI